MTFSMIEQMRKARFRPPVWLESLIFLLVFFAAQFCQGLFQSVPLMAHIAGTGQLAKYLTGQLSVAEIGALAHAPVVLMWSFLSNLIPIGFVLFYCLVIKRAPSAALGLARKGAPADWGLGVAVALGTLAAVYGALLLTGYVTAATCNGFSPLLIGYVIGFVVQSASEELLVRGYYMNAVAARSRLPAAVLLNSLLFTALHLFNPGIGWLPLLNLFLFGIIFSLLALLTDNLWMACGMHFAWNFALGCLLGGNVSGMGMTSLFTLTLSGAAVATGGPFGIEGSAFTTAAGVALIALLIVLLARQEKRGPAVNYS